MEISIKAAVQCTDGPGGHVERLLVDPGARKITHIVVRESGMRGNEWMVPVGDIVSSTRETVTLKLTQKQLSYAQPFNEKAFRPLVDDTSNPGLSWTAQPYSEEIGSSAFQIYGASAVEPGKTVQSSIPEGEVTLKLGNKVEATDGGAGKVDELMFDAQTGVITHLVMQEGHLWGKRHVAVPVEQIDHIDKGTVHLKLSKAQIDALPDAN
jgi:uncharacterized protein YrrD